MTQEVKLKRSQCNYRAENARFLLECDFSKQYFHYYRKRLEKTRPFLECNCRSKWSPSIPIYSLAELASVTDLNDNDITLTSPVTPDLQSPGSFLDIKRMRRLSQSSAPESPQPTTSTQKDQLFTTPTISSIRTDQLQSPISLVNSVQQCIVIGTIFKRMKLQPDVIKELSCGDHHIKCERYLGNYTSQDDRLVLEDSEESILLTGNIDPKNFVTGIVVALLGIPIDDGSQFQVNEICYAEPNFQLLYPDLPLSIPCNRTEQEPIYLLVVSGLGFHRDMDKKSTLTRALQDLIDFVWGGAKFCEDKRSSQVSRILVAGGNLSDSRLDPDDELIIDKVDIATKMKQSRQVKPYTSSIQAVKHMDDFFAQLSKTINVDVMPGPTDPSSHIMPQQPFHPCMFPKSCIFPSFNCTTNPYHATLDDTVEVFVTSGQNIDIISKFSGIQDPLEIMNCHLKWGNCAPSAPDNLYSVPYETDDPYVIDFIPDIYIAGCQDSYRTDYYSYSSSQTVVDDQPSAPKQRTLLLTIPRFDETFSCVLINLKNLQTTLLSFR